MKKTPKRAALRFKLPGKTISYMANGQLGEAVLVNISSGGCAVAETTENLNVNDPVLIVLELTDSERPLELEGAVVRSGQGSFSCKFTKLQEDFLKNFPKQLALEYRTILQQEQARQQAEPDIFTDPTHSKEN